MSEGDEFRAEFKLVTDPQKLEDFHLGFLDWMEKRMTDQVEEYLLKLGRDSGVFCKKWNAGILVMMNEAREALGIVGERERAVAVRAISTKIAVAFLEQIRSAVVQKKAEIAANPPGEAVESDVVQVVESLVFYVRRAFGIAKKESEKARKKPIE